MGLVDVKFKDGRSMKVYPHEVAVLRKAGKLKEEKRPAKTKEQKDTGETKQEKDAGETKVDQKAANERMTPSKKRPVVISSASINKGKKA